MPTQNVYQCRTQEEKPTAALINNGGQLDKDNAGTTANGSNQIVPTSSNSLTSFHSQVFLLY